ncbi:MAG: pyrophosphohydrolase [Planctomycetota bacterium]|jgi:8-oxo-dGTP diphosphatase
MTKPIGIAVVWSQDHVLVGLRAHNTVLAGMSEFPGGKCELDETPRSCAVRECQEETGLVVIPVKQLATVLWKYPHGDVELHFWKCQLAPDLPPLATPSSPFRWVTPQEASQLAFPPANQSVLQTLLTPHS